MSDDKLPPDCYSPFDVWVNPFALALGFAVFDGGLTVYFGPLVMTWRWRGPRRDGR